jgi:hypothetical protein
MPMRIANLAALDLSRHVVKTGHGRNRALHIVIPGTETKTGEPYEVIIPADTAALLETYRSPADHDLFARSVKMVAGTRNHLDLLLTG